MSFFSFEWLNKKYKEFKDYKLKVILAPRNTGKSYGTYDYILKNGGFTPEKKVVLLRNNQLQLKQMTSDFQSRFSDRFIVKGERIYEAIPGTLINKKTKQEIQTIKQGSLVGYFASVYNQHNYKSLEAKDVKYIFYEEFNEDALSGTKNVYFKFFNIIKTFSRFNDPEIIMLGNKDDFKNDFFINWDIETADTTDQDYVQVIKNLDDEDIGIWYDLSAKNFVDLNNSNTLADKIGRADVRTGNFAKGGFKDIANGMVWNFKRYLPYAKVKYKVGINGNEYYYCSLGDSKDVCLISTTNHTFDKKVPTYALDRKSLSLGGEFKLTDEEANTEFLTLLFSKFRQGRLFFDSYYAFEDIKLNLHIITNWVNTVSY